MFIFFFVPLFYVEVHGKVLHAARDQFLNVSGNVLLYLCVVIALIGLARYAAACVIAVYTFWYGNKAFHISDVMMIYPILRIVTLI